MVFGGSNLGVIGKNSDPHKKNDIYIFVTKIDKVEQEIKEKLDRSASKLDRPTSEMPGMHQPSAFSRIILVSLLQVPTTQLANMSVDPKFVELTADVLDFFFSIRRTLG